MRKPEKLKIVMIGAGSVCFCPATLGDILTNDNICSVPLTVALMDIDADALRVSEEYAKKAIELTGRKVTLQATTNLEEALKEADFVVSAIEVDRYYYWSMDFHIPRRYGFRQVYGENGGPGSMFHTLRNLPPHAAHRQNHGEDLPRRMAFELHQPRSQAGGRRSEKYQNQSGGSLPRRGHGA